MERPAASAGPALASIDQLVGRTLNGRYGVQRKIGEGGFGAVFEGLHLQMNRPVAIKVLYPRLTRDPQMAARFRREAQAACSLRDPHTVTTHDFDQSAEGVMHDPNGETIARLTSAGQIFGTLDFMSPEQMTGGEMDHRTDIYALGAMLYQMLTGTPPFTGGPSQLIASHLNVVPVEETVIEGRIATPELVPAPAKVCVKGLP